MSNNQKAVKYNPSDSKNVIKYALLRISWKFYYFLNPGISQGLIAFLRSHLKTSTGPLDSKRILIHCISRDDQMVC